MLGGELHTLGRAIGVSRVASGGDTAPPPELSSSSGTLMMKMGGREGGESGEEKYKIEQKIDCGGVMV